MGIYDLANTGKYNAEHSQAFSVQTTSRKLSLVYHLSAIRIISAFSTISDESGACFGIVNDNMQRIYFCRLVDPDIRAEKRWTSMCKLQTRWEQGLKDYYPFDLWMKNRHVVGLSTDMHRTYTLITLLKPFAYNLAYYLPTLTSRFSKELMSICELFSLIFYALYL